MKVAISYPPLEGAGVPLLQQNRQFQWFASPTYIYPVVPAQAATLLKERGFEVMWDDAIAEGLAYGQWLARIRAQRPELIAIETKTPVVKRHWRIVSELKALEWSPWVVLMGDHVTAMPEESLGESPVDFVLTGGDYDFLLLSLCEALAGGTLDASRLEPGIWHRGPRGQAASTGQFRLDHDLCKLPLIDRELTKWRLYSEKNGNYKRLPGAYTMAGRDCWWGKCSFCSWTGLYPSYRVRTPESLLDEVGLLADRYGVREVMDDTGTFPTGGWLAEFCEGMMRRGYSGRVSMDCNMRFGAVGRDELKLMKRAGFRLLLFGLESASASTLERLNKGVGVERMVESCREAREAGLYPHITLMLGYPWETLDEAMETVCLGKRLLREGWAWTVQATVVVPYPGTPLFEHCRRGNLLKTLDWDHYDMRGPVVRTLYPEEQARALVKSIYSSAFSPRFLFRKAASIRDMDDLRYFARAGGKVLGHLLDFGRKAECA